MATTRVLPPRSGLLCTLLVCLAAAFVCLSQAFGAIDPNTWTQTSGSNNFNTAGNWGDGNTPNADDAALVTNNVAANVTNIAYTSASTSWFGDDLSGLVVSNSNTAGSGINMVLINSGHHMEMHQLVIGNNGIVQILNNATLSSYRGGTLSSGGTLWLNGGTYRNNGESRGTFLIDGTVIADSGTMDGSPFSANNLTFIVRSGGRMIANSGTFWVNTDDAWNNSGLRIESGGTLQVNSGATFVLNRTTGAWTGGASAVTNNGTIFLSGGTFTFAEGGAQAANRFVFNNGTIVGAGTIAASVKQGASDFTIASNGVLNIFGTYNGNQATFTFATSSSDYGTFKAVSGGTLKIVGNVASGMGGAWIVDSGGTLEIASSVNVDLGAAYVPGGNLNGTVKVNSGANLTIAAATAGGPTLHQNGTFEFAGGTIFMPNATGLAAFTNAGWFVNTTTSAGTFQTGFGAGQNNYGIVNTGTIFVNGGGTLVVNSVDAAAVGGFSNVASGVIIVSNNSNFAIRRDANAWGNGSANVAINMGQVILNDGTLLTQAGASADATRMLRNIGTISAGANSTNTLFASVQNQGTIALTNTASEIRLAGTGTATANASTGVIDVRNSSRLILTNLGTSSGLSFTNAGTIRLQNGTVIGGVISNTGTIIGDGTVTGGGVVNSGLILASNLTANAATLTVQLNSFTNAANATIGVLGTSTVLNVWTPGNTPVLINLGTVTLSGGTITNSQVAGAFTITNFNVIAGVGDLASLPVVNQAGSSIIAQNPVQGISNLFATVANTNASILGATAVGGAATLNLSVTSGGLVNNGTIALQGGFLSVSNGTGVASVTNLNGLIYGNTNQTLRIANLSGGRIMASNGVFGIGLESNLNQGILSNFNSASTIRLTNSILVNTGSISLMGGGLVLSGSTITNQGTITGPGDISSALYNDTTGFVAATNGTLNVATNSGEFVTNLGTFDVASGATLNVVPAWNNTNGTVRMAGGTLTGGTISNKGTILGSGTITADLLNLAAGTVKATNSDLNIRSTTVTQSGTMIGGTGGATIVMTNLTQNLVNTGTMILDSTPGGATNVAFYILRQSGGSGNFTNAVGGVIRGTGQLVTGDGVGGGRNFTVHNFGSMFATNGALIVNPGDAFGDGGFINQSSGIVDIASGATFGIQRTANAWNNSGVLPRNSGTIAINGGVLAFYTNGLLQSKALLMTNGPTGTIVGSGTIAGGVINAGTVTATNGTLFIDSSSPTNILQSGTINVASGATLTILSTTGSFENGGNFNLFGGTFVATNMSRIANLAAGTVTGFGTIQAGTTSGSGGANAEIINFGTIVATNGTLFVNPGDAFNSGGFSNAAGATVRIASGATLTINRTANAWTSVAGTAVRFIGNLGTMDLAGGTFQLFEDGALNKGRLIMNDGTIRGYGTISASVTNFGTIAATNGTLVIDGTGKFRQAGTLSVDTSGTLVLTNIAAGLGSSFTNEASIIMRGGELQAGVIANTNVIFGFGTISGGGVDNFGQLLASNGVLTAGISSFTNRSTATLGTLSTNATLDVTMPGGVGQPLINQGTIFMQGGTLLFNGLNSGTITNTTTGFIKGVGNVTQTVVNNGTIMAANPVNGLNVFSVGLSDLNSATIGASNNATLNVVISGGAQTTFSNIGSISMIGGTLIISNGSPGVITNNAWVTGVGTVSAGIYNNSTIAATVNGGVLTVNMNGGTNNASGWLQAGTGATLQFSNPSMVNLGTIAAFSGAGGYVGMTTASGIITNRGFITGENNLTFSSYVHNDSVGTMVATNGTLAFNAINGLGNTGTINIETSGTLQSNSSNSWSNTGTINMRGGTLRTGGFTNVATATIWTNAGNVNGYGTILGGGAYGGSGAGFDKAVANLGTILVTNPLGTAGVTLTINTGGATTADGIRNLGNIIISSNNTLVLSRSGTLPILNTGTITINNGTLTGSGVLSNTTGGIIQGYGTLTHEIVNLSGGTIRATNGNLTMTAAIFPINFGTLQVANGATMTWNTSNAWQNSGTIDMRGGTLRTGGFTLTHHGESFTNAAGGLITGFGTIIGGGAYGGSGQGIDKAILNYGTVIASGGTLTIDTGFATTNRGLANFGYMVVATSNDTLHLARHAEVTALVTNLNYLYNSGTILIHGGTLTSNTAITNQQETVSLPGLIQGWGHVALTNELVNLGTIRSTNTVAGGDGILHFTNPTGGDVLDIFQSGTLVVEGAGVGGAISEMIFGSSTNAVLVNRGTITMRGGYLRSGVLTNINLARISGFGTITSPILNSGTLLANSLSADLHLTGATIFNQTNGFFGASSGRLIVDTVFTNAGTVSFLNSVGTFSGQVLNRGAWIMDPSTNVFNATYTVASNGYITMTGGDVMIFKSNFVNQSRLSNTYDTVTGKFIFDGDGGYTQAFYVAGLDFLGTNLPPIGGVVNQTNAFGSGSWSDVVIGYTNNFALYTLELGSLTSTSTLMLIDTFGTIDTNDDRTAGLYVNTLVINPGSLLIISNNVEFYFIYTNGVTGVSIGTLNPGDNVLILGDGSFHQLVFIPEPSILMLLLIGGGAIHWYRRHHATRRSPRA